MWNPGEGWQKLARICQEYADCFDFIEKGKEGKWKWKESHSRRNDIIDLGTGAAAIAEILVLGVLRDKGQEPPANVHLQLIAAIVVALGKEMKKLCGEDILGLEDEEPEPAEPEPEEPEPEEKPGSVQSQKRYVLENPHFKDKDEAMNYLRNDLMGENHRRYRHSLNDDDVFSIIFAWNGELLAEFFLDDVEEPTDEDREVHDTTRKVFIVHSVSIFRDTTVKAADVGLTNYQLGREVPKDVYDLIVEKAGGFAEVIPDPDEVQRQTTTINYIIVPVSNMHRSIVFYRDILGIRVGFHTDKWTWFRAGGIGFNLELAAVPDPAHTHATAPAGHCQIGLNVPDLDAFHAQMVSKGVTCLQPPMEDHFGKQAIYADPDGTPISVVAETEDWEEAVPEEQPVATDKPQESPTSEP
jgi:predicted enzyme related to lactoylglutathione lyase